METNLVRICLYNGEHKIISHPDFELVDFMFFDNFIIFIVVNGILKGYCTETNSWLEWDFDVGLYRKYGKRVKDTEHLAFAFRTTIIHFNLKAATYSHVCLNF